MVFAGVGSPNETVQSPGERLTLMVFMAISLVTELEKHSQVLTLTLIALTKPLPLSLSRRLLEVGSRRRVLPSMSSATGVYDDLCMTQAGSISGGSGRGGEEVRAKVG